MAILKKGSKGPKVKKLQEDLKLLEYSVGTPDGDFGPKTERAVKKFQKDAQIAIDGRVGPATQSKIKEKIEEKKKAGEEAAATPDPQILEAQERLRFLKYGASESGKLDLETEQAIRQFQQKAGLTIDGQVTPELIEALEKEQEKILDADFEQVAKTDNLRRSRESKAIVLNSIFREIPKKQRVTGPEEQSLNDFLFSEDFKPPARASGLSTGKVAFETFPLTAMISFPRYFADRLQNVEKLFDFLERRLEERKKTDSLNVRGKSFKQDFKNLQSTSSLVKKQISKIKDSTWQSFIRNGIDNKYQIVIEANDNYDFLGMWIFALDPQEKHVKRMQIASMTDFDLVELSGDTLRYLENLDFLSKLGQMDLDKAEAILSCGLETTDKKLSPLLDVIKFSKKFQSPSIEIVKESNALIRETVVLPVSNFSKTMQATNDAIESIFNNITPAGGGRFEANAEILTGLSGDELAEVWKTGFLDPFLLKICPATLPRRVLECLLPSDCRELIKYVGIFRARDIIKNLGLTDVFDDRAEALDVLDSWDRAIEERYNFRAVRFNNGAGLKSGPFNGTTFFQTPVQSSTVSVSLLVRTNEAQFKRMQGSRRYIFSQAGTFAISKTKGDNLAIEIQSADGKTAEYSTEPSGISIFDNRWHQIGFSWVGPAGLLTVYIDGVAVPTKFTQGTQFAGPLNVEETGSEIIVASEKSSESSKAFSGQIDEICIFAQALGPDSWKKLATIESDVNLNTMGLSQNAVAWWRMGDSFEDTLANNAPGGKIVDKIGGINLTKIPEFEDQSTIVVAHPVKEKDEDFFIDILANQSDLLIMCDAIYSAIGDAVNLAFDPNTVAENIKRQFAIPTFSADPHAQVSIIVKNVVVENLIKLLATFTLNLIQKYLLDCQNWKTLLKAVAQTGFTDSTVKRLSESSAPLAKLISGLDDPSFWNDFAKESEGYLNDSLREVTNSVRAKTTVSGSAGETTIGEVTTLGLGNVSFQEEQTMGVEVSPWSMLGSDLPIAVSETSSQSEQNTVIEIVKKTSQKIPPAEFLELLSSEASQKTVLEVQQIFNSELTEPGLIFTSSDIRTFFGSFGDAMGVQGLIGQLQNAAQDINRNSDLPEEFCLPGQTFSDRVGLPPGRKAKEMNKAAVQDVLDTADEINTAGNDSQCPVAIPLSEFEKEALRSATIAAYSPVTTAYDNDLLLYRLGMTSITEVKEEIPKVLWKGETIKRQTYEQEKGFSEIEIEIKKTQINPEFEALLEQGLVPLKKDGSPDGTRFGGVVKINWNILDIFNEETPFLSEKKPPASLAPKVEGDSVKDPDVEIKDIGSSLGPFTDYEEPNAVISRPVAKLGGEMANSLSKGKLDFTLKDDQEPTSYFSDRNEKLSKRGYKDIVSKTKLSLLAAPGQKESDQIQDSFSTVTHKVPFGRSLQGTKYVSFDKTGADPFYFDDVPLEFNLSSNLQDEIKNRGYDDSESACDPLDPNSDFELQESERYTPQEHVFAMISRENTPNLSMTDEVLKKGAYDQLYREVLTALLYKVGDSPLLKAVPGSKDTTNDALIGLNFLNLDVNPRLIDMQSFADQVSDDFNNLVACPEGLTQPPLQEALKTSVPRILARVCVADIVLKGIIPFSQLFFSKNDPVIKSFIIERLDSDIQFFSDDPDATKAKIVQQYNKLSKSGAVDGPSLEEDDFLQVWKTAMEFFVEDEFDFVANRLKEIVHGKCIEPQQSSADNINEEMYLSLLSYAENNSANLNFKEVAVYFNGDIKENFSLRTDHQDIEKIVTTLSFSFADNEIVLSKIEKPVEELLSELDIDFDSIDCSQSSVYPATGQTTSAETHYHQYEIDENGNGRTTSVVGSFPDHEHAIYDFAVVPLLGSSDETLHIHSLVSGREQSTVEDFEVAARVSEHLKKELINTSDFKILFDFSFNLNDAASLVLVYSLLAADNQVMSRAFNGTKKAVISMFDWLWLAGASVDPCADKNGIAGMNQEGLLPDMADAFSNPQLFLMMLLAPLLTFRGWTRTADPHVFITTTIMDILKAPIFPKEVKKNRPDPFDDGKVKCMDTWQWPGYGLFDLAALSENPTAAVPATLLVEPAVATAVTFLTTPGTPFPPTPFGFIYYGLVSPIIWLLKDLPRMLALMENDPNAQQLLASTGMNIGPISCDDNVPTATETSSTEPQDEDCPPIRTFQDTIIDSASANCD
jgi:peptidoglycan hydrolase-like protein with peptidoglycan-binding domain